MAPEGWSRAKLGDLFAEVAENRNEERLPVLAVTLDRGVVRRDSLDRKMDREVDQGAYLRALPGDIAYNTMRMWQGGSGLVREAGFVSPAYTILRPRREECSEFWAHAFKSPELIEEFRCYSQGVAKDRLRLYYDQFAAVPVLRPPLPEQREIAAILSSVDETIEKTEGVIAQLEVVKKAMLEELLTQGRRRSDWRKARLSEVAKIRRGASPRPIQDPRWFSDCGPGWVRIADVTRSQRILKNTEQKLSAEGCARSVRIGAGDVIMSIAASIGKPIVSGIDACIHDGFVVFDELHENVDPMFLYYTLQWTSRQFSDLGQLGTQKNINTTIVGEMEIPIPPRADQDRISGALGSADDCIESQQCELRRLRSIKSSLTSALLRGELRISRGANVA
jgi:type I restriction enzyme S subunit